MEKDRFWSVSKNKSALQRLFTKRVHNKVKSKQFDKLLFLGGSLKEKNAMCISFVNRLVSVEKLPECTHGEADDRIFDDWSYCISALHHFWKLKYFDLEELWFVSGKGNSRTFFPIHDLTTDLDSQVSEVLSAIHALTRCDAASKVGTKSRAVREGAACYHLLYAFGRDALSDEMIADAETFLLKYITKHDVDTLDELRFIVYHEKYLEFATEHFLPNSDNLRKHTLRAYLQCYIWLHSAFLENIELHPLEYGYRLTEDRNLVPIISTNPSILCNFP